MYFKAKLYLLLAAVVCVAGATATPEDSNLQNDLVQVQFYGEAL